MANEPDSKNSNTPPVAVFAAAFLAFMIAVFFMGWLVMKFHQPKVKENVLPRTGMSILYTQR
ncbi:MAG: hypothetical protein ACRYGF_09140 [Janthinobacterium lividum]